MVAKTEWNQQKEAWKTLEKTNKTGLAPGKDAEVKPRPPTWNFQVGKSRFGTLQWWVFWVFSRFFPGFECPLVAGRKLGVYVFWGGFQFEVGFSRFPLQVTTRVPQLFGPFLLE